MSIITDAKKVYGKTVPDFGDFYGYIEKWDDIFCNRPEWRRVKKSGLYAKGDRLINALCAAKVLADEFARLTFSEQVTISVAEPYLEYVTSALNEGGFWKRMPEFLSQAYALGGGVVKVYAENKKPKLNYIAADRFAPTAWDERDVAEGVLESRIRKDGFFYTLFERHSFSDDSRTEIEHRLYKSSQRNSIGKPCELSELFPDVDETVTYKTAEPMLRYFKPDVSNNIDRCCPLGVSVFSSATDTLKALDVAFDSFGREFTLGKKRIIVPSSCIQTVVDPETGNLRKYFDADDEAFIALKCDEERDLKITDNTVELRIEEHVAAINALLNILCFQTGLSSGTFSFEGSQGLKTATEVISADSKTARTAKGNKNLVAEFIEGIVRSIIAVGIEMGDLSESGDYGILITMPDGVVIDDNTKIENNIKLVSAGLKSKLAAIMDVRNCDEAVRNCIKKFSQKGIPAFVDKRGREWSPEAYINMDIRTTVNNTANAAQDACCDRYGLDLIQISSHMGARPKCAIDQGKLYSRSNRSGIAHDGDGNPIPFYPWSGTSYGQPDGILGINCHHHKYPFADGVNFQRYFPYDEEENAERYKEFQKQRAMERRVREVSRQAEMLEAAGDTEGAKAARRQLRDRRKAYREYSKEHGLAVHNDRLTVVKVKNGDMSYKNVYTSALDKSGESDIIKVTNEKGIENDMKLFSETHTAAGNRRSPLYKLSEADVKFVQEEITAINANADDFVFNSDYTRGTCFLASDGKVHIKGNIFPDEYSDHPRDKMSVRAVLAHEYYGHRPYREQYIREDNDTSEESINKIMARAWADEFRASYMAAKNAPNLSDDDRRLLILDSLSRADEAGISIKYNDFIRRVLYG